MLFFFVCCLLELNRSYNLCNVQILYSWNIFDSPGWLNLLLHDLSESGPDKFDLGAINSVTCAQCEAGTYSTSSGRIFMICKCSVRVRKAKCIGWQKLILIVIYVRHHMFDGFLYCLICRGSAAVYLQLVWRWVLFKQPRSFLTLSFLFKIIFAFKNFLSAI